MLTAVNWNIDTDGFWDVAANWSTGQVPASGDDVTIDRGTANPTITIRDSRTVTSITSRESLIATGGTLTVNAASQIDGSTLTLNGGNLTANGAVTITASGMFEWQSGTISGNGLANSGTITISAAANVSLNGRLTNSGTINHTGIGNLVLVGTITNDVNATYDFQNDAGLFGIPGANFLNNSGTIKKTGGSGLSTIGMPIPNSNDSSLNFNNTGGTLDGQSGTLQLLATSGASTGGMFNAATGAVLDLVPNRGARFAGTFTGTGGGTVQLSGGTLNVTDTAGPGAIFNFPAGLFQWSGGSIGNTHPIHPFTNTGTITLAGANDKGLNGSAFNNSGTIIHTGTGNLLLGSTFTNLDTLTNNSGAIYDFQSDAGLFATPGTHFLNNSGTIQKTGGSGVSTIGTPNPNPNGNTFHFSNTGGTLDAQSGTLQLFNTSGGSGGSGSSGNTGGTFNASTGAVLELVPNNGARFSGTFTGTGGGQVELSGGVLVTTGAGATFDFPDGLFHWTGGSIGNGTFVNTGSITISGPNGKGLNGNGFSNAGTIVNVGPGSFNIAEFTFENRVGATFEHRGDSPFLADPSQFHNPGRFINAGMLKKTAGTGTVLFGGSVDNLATGTIEVHSGRLTLNRGGNSTGGTFNMSAGELCSNSPE